MRTLTILAVSFAALFAHTLALPPRRGGAAAGPSGTQNQNLNQAQTAQAAALPRPLPPLQQLRFVDSDQAWYAADPGLTQVTNDQLWLYAKAFWDQIPDKRALLVSVIFAPGQGLFMGTKPRSRGTQAATQHLTAAISNIARDYAHNVYSVLQQRNDNYDNKRVTALKKDQDELQRIHAEDFAFIMAAQTIGQTGGVHTPTAFQFQSAATGATWGRMGYQTPAEPQDACGTVGDKARILPTCATTQAGLNVHYLVKGSAPAAVRQGGAGRQVPSDPETDTATPRSGSSSDSSEDRPSSAAEAVKLQPRPPRGPPLPHQPGLMRRAVVAVAA